MYSQSFSSSSSSNSNSPPAQPMLFQVGDPMLQDYATQGYGQPAADQQYHHFQQDNNQMMTFPQLFEMNQQNEFNGDQYVMDPTQQYQQLFDNNGMDFYGQQQFEHYPVTDFGRVTLTQRNFIGANADMYPGFPDIPKENFKFEDTAPMRKRRSPKNNIKKVTAMHANTSCINCGCRETKLWRRNEKGEPECNPCNLYERFKGVKRPEHLWNKPTGKRRRRPVAPIAPVDDIDEFQIQAKY